ncbi:TPA: SMC family ATPase [Candidatus Woesearchaeota archaeon]|nr:SMC family ATPase [Candidatus Woesearchaeota archaeon]HIH47483.1 SMC family ATPase [Candidatus Woesearchaeota archaeon]HII88329.1 SMC family ATPase [Candidatus Woesearchaeota archaeon]
MLLRSLKLENIRSHTRSTITFPKGKVLLQGDIGSGKSSVLLALEFALFGTQQGLSGASLLRHDAREGSVELHVVLPSITQQNILQEIIIKRTLKRTKQGIAQEAGYLIADGMKTDGTAIELKAKMYELLGYPLDLVSKTKSLLYRYTVYTPQEEMKAILTQDPELRLNILRKLFGIDRYKQMKDNIGLYTKEMRTEIRILQAKTEDLELKKDALRVEEEKQKTLQQTVNQAQHRVQEQKQKLDEQKKRKEQIEQTIKNYQEQEKQKAMIQTQIEEKNRVLIKEKNEQEILKKTIIALHRKKGMLQDEEPFIAEELLQQREAFEQQGAIKEQDIQHLQQQAQLAVAQQEKIRALNRALSQLKSEMDQQEQELTMLDEKKQELAELTRLVQELPQREGEQEKLQQELQHHALRKNELEIFLNESRKKQQYIEELDACPTCLQSVPSEHKQRIKASEAEQSARYEEELKTWLVQQQTLQQTMMHMNNRITELRQCALHRGKLQTEIVLLERVHKNLEGKKVLYQTYLDEKDSLAKNFITINQEELEKKQKSLAYHRQLLKRIQEIGYVKDQLQEKQEQLNRRQKEEQDVVQEIAELEKQKIELEKILVAYSGLLEQYSREKQQEEEEQRILKHHELEYARLEKDRDALNKVIEQLNHEIQTKEAVKQKMERLQMLHHWMEEVLYTMITTMEKRRMASIHQSFNYLLRQWFMMLIEDELLQVSLQEDFSLRVEQNGYETELDHLSGGEKTAVALAYRLALNRVINDMVSTINTKHLIILDEPTDGFSSEQLDKMREVLDQLNMEQIILVSHETKIEGFVDHMIRMNKGEHGTVVDG